MARLEYSRQSQYSDTPQTSWYQDLYVHRSFTFSDSDSYFTITPEYQYRPDLLSNVLYGSPKYKWVFAVRNMDIIKDPVWDFKSGVKIRIPPVDVIKSEIG